MGLDWHLAAPALPGHDSQIAAIDDQLESIFAEINALEAAGVFDDGIDAEGSKLFKASDELRARRKALLVVPGAVAGAPRLGIDPEATKWLANAHDEFQKYMPFDPKRWPGFLDTLKKKYRGCHVAQLSRDRDAIPAFPAGVGVGMIAMVGGNYDFRGQVVASCGEVIGDELVSASCRPMSAEDACELAARLEQRMTGCGDAQVVDIVGAAARWLRYWGEHGFGIAVSA
jgi:hypothetical protein